MHKLNTPTRKGGFFRILTQKNFMCISRGKITWQIFRDIFYDILLFKVTFDLSDLVS